MQIRVLIEPIAGDGFRARGGDPFAMVAEGPTREEALARLQALIREKLGAGAEIAPIEVPEPPPGNPWLAMAGMWDEGDPLVRAWKETMEENRRKADG